MKQVVFNEELQEAARKIESPSAEFRNNKYLNKATKVEVNFGLMSATEVDALLEVFDREAQTNTIKGKHYFRVARKVRDYVHLANNRVEGDLTVKKLEMLPAAIQGYLKDAPHRWVFRQQEDGPVTPHFVKEIKYIKGHYSHGEYIPPQADMTLLSYKRRSRSEVTVSWYRGDVPCTVSSALTRKGMYRETPEAVLSYQEQFDRYNTLQGAIGLQVQGIGVGRTAGQSRWSGDTRVALVREGIPAKLVLDDSTEEDDQNASGRSSGNRFYTDNFWGEVPIRNGMVAHEEVTEGTSDEPNTVELPVLPYLKMYDMAKDQWIVAHVDAVEEYPWDKSLGAKLVLKAEDKSLIDLLVNQTGERVDDIVAGKMQGVIVLATGSPGVGKTLTAEVFSEMIEKPLYTVQCSQLGLNVDQVEKNLNKVLNRAGRWGAILLLDEADVYIRQRGEDITQNAIVGVFLRLLEYYRGVIFMTSNRGEAIDDAIISRATAWIKYEKPGQDMLTQLWKILGTQYGAKFKDKEIEQLVNHETLSHISGRTVRNLLKLARMLVGVKGTISIETIDQVSKYQLLD